MAGVEPFKALHYDLDEGRVARRRRRSSLRRDRRRDAGRAGSRARPHNVVELDLPRDPDGGDPYEHAAKLLEEWKGEGALVDDDEPAIWALTQDYTAPDGRTMTRRGFLARVKLAEYGEGVRPHERTQPGPKEDRLRLTRATKHNLSPIFSLHPGDAWQHIEPALGGDPWGEATDPDGTVHRVWRVGDPAVHEAIASELADGELLIADGHHRYETAMTYAREVGGEGPHNYVLMALVSLEDPGLTVFATHRMLKDLGKEQQEAIRDAAMASFELAEVGERRARPRPRRAARSASATWTPTTWQPWRLRLTDEGAAKLDEILAGRSEAYRRLDAAALEELFLKEAVGMSADDIAAKKRHRLHAEHRGRGREARRPRSTTPPSSSAPPRSSRSAPSPTPARRCRRSPPTSSPSCSPASSSTR